jgi:hypothetical protein
LAFVLAITLSLVVFARPVAAGTAETMEASLLSWINSARSERGLPALVRRADLADLAGDRAAAMAAAGVMSHEIGGCLQCQLNARHIVWHLYGETIAGTSFPWGMDAARSLFSALKGSPSHWDLLMGRAFDQVGIGVAYRSANQNTYLSIVLIDGDPLSNPAPPPRRSAPRSAAAVATLVQPVLPNLDRRRDASAWYFAFGLDWTREPQASFRVGRLTYQL